MKIKFLVIGWADDIKDYICPDIVYSNESFNDNEDYNSVLQRSKDLAIRAYNQHYLDKNLKGIIVAKFDLIKDNKIEEIYNNFTKEQVDKLYSECWDAGCGGQFGNIDTSWELSDLTDSDEFISINKYLPEDLCYCLYGRIPGQRNRKTFTKDCICKFDDGTMKFAHRIMIDPDNEEEQIEWIKEWTKRIIKNEANSQIGIISCCPAYHWQMPHEWADRVVAWRWFKEGENKYQYM